MSQLVVARRSRLSSEPYALRQRPHRTYIIRQLRSSRRGLVLSAAFAAALLTGLLPVPAAALPVLLGLTALFGITRLMRGFWALRVARHRFSGWRARRHIVEQSEATRIVPESADRRAGIALTPAGGEPLLGRVRERGLQLADRLTELRGILADAGLSPALRRPVAEALARSEEELEALLAAVGELARADERQREDLLARLAARLEIDEAVPSGLYAG